MGGWATECPKKGAYNHFIDLYAEAITTDIRIFQPVRKWWASGRRDEGSGWVGEYYERRREAVAAEAEAAAAAKVACGMWQPQCGRNCCCSC